MTRIRSVRRLKTIGDHYFKVGPKKICSKSWCTLFKSCFAGLENNFCVISSGIQQHDQEMPVLHLYRLCPQAARDRNADLRRQLAELAGGQWAKPGEHHLTARLAPVRAAVHPSCARAPAAADVRRLLKLLSATLVMCTSWKTPENMTSVKWWLRCFIVNNYYNEILKYELTLSNLYIRSIYNSLIFDECSWSEILPRQYYLNLMSFRLMRSVESVRLRWPRRVPAPVYWLRSAISYNVSICPKGSLCRCFVSDCKFWIRRVRVNEIYFIELLW